MNSSGIITAPVGIDADIAPVLGVASYDLGYLCSNQHGKTNKYSRKKPVKIKGIDINLTQPADWWKGENKQCGLNIPHRKQITACINDYFDGSMKWGYDAPEPNHVYPARALDFNGYYHYAMNPITVETFPNDIWLTVGQGECNLDFSLDIVTEGTDYNLGLSDIDIKQIDDSSEHIVDWYPGLVFKSLNRNDYFAMTSEKQLSTGSFDIRVSGTSNRLEGKWQVMPFLSTIPVDTYNGDDKEGCYICADVDPLTITIHAPGTLTYGLLSAIFVDSPDYPKNRKVSYIGQIINRRTSDTTFNVTLGIGYTPDGKHPMNGGELTNTKLLEIGEVFIPAAASTAEKDEVTVWIASSDHIDGEYDYLDIGTTYAPEAGFPNAKYWTFMQIGNEPIPFASYYQVEEAVPEG